MSGFAGGVLLILVGTLVISQVTAGQALQRLGLVLCAASCSRRSRSPASRWS